ncbi:hypothetical protein [Stakelama tenebrarum]|uniref:Uncharacterized protein n=1 Tax=Stakelama tenebrarum TaxID=2711215 RepID=A0A6G6Y328_9SPHN|nr:hypothetical protein [Sphingosinithalassobacter tenebrarum]QIG78976.1 hypothetical protein G5C33_03695 [Sphingosinithalassobacter tenebrarum]
MTTTGFPLLLVIAILVTAVTGIWLLLNARSVAALFRGVPDIEPGPGRKRAPRGTTIVMLILFNIGWISAVAIEWTAWNGAANAVTQAQPYMD